MTGFRRLSLLWIAAGLLLAACGAGDSGADAEPLPTLFVLGDAAVTATIPAAVSAIPPAATDAALPTQIPVLLSWAAVEGTLDGLTADVWQFFGAEADAIRLRAIGRDVDVTMRLIGPDGGLIATGDTIEATLDTAAVYLVEVESVAPGGIGTYDLGLGYTDRPNPADAADIPVPELVGVPTPAPAYRGTGTFIDSLTDNETVGGDLRDEAQTHIYTFDGVGGQYIELAMTRVSGAIDPVVTVFDPDGNPLAMDDNSGGERDALLRNLRLPADGLYSVQAGGGGFAGSYAIRLLATTDPAPVQATTAPSPTPSPTFDASTPTIGAATRGARLFDHVPLVDSLIQGDGVNQYTFEVAAGEAFAVGVNPLPGSTMRPRLEVIDPNGAVLGGEAVVAPAPGAAAELGLTSAETGGVYRVFVTAEGGIIGAYAISYGSGTTRREALRGLLGPDSTMRAVLEQPFTRDVWSLYLSAGDIISAAAQADSGSPLDPILELIPADGAQGVIAVDDNSGGGTGALLSNLRIQQSGIYQLRVRAVAGETTGAYTLVWRYVNRAPTATPLPSTAVLMTVDDTVAGATYSFYPFQGRAGQRVRVRVIGQAGSGFDPVAALVAPDGSVIAEADDTEGDLNPRFIVALPLDGTYQVRVNGYRDGGPFTLYVEDVLQ